VTVSAFLAELRTRDIHVWADGNRLQCNAPAGALTPELRDQLQRRRREILEYLGGPAELSFSQQRLWLLDQLAPGNPFYNLVGAMLVEGGGAVEPYRLVLALTRAAERLGVRVRHGRAIGLRRDDGRVTGVVLEREVLSCATAVLALGPWSAEASDWIGVPIDVRPLKGQILRLQAPGPPVECSVGWGHNYATTKTDGLLWAGTTEEEAGFDEESTLAARDEIGAALLKMLPAMADAQVAQQTACLRPVASDGLLVLGGVPGLDHAYVATGGARKGILYGPAMGQAIADLVLGRDTRVALDAFAPGRFAGARELPRR